MPTIGEEKDEGDGNGSDANEPPQTPPETGQLDAPKLGAAGQAAMLGMVQARLQSLMGRSSGYIEGLPIGTKRKVEALKGVQVQWESLHLQFKMESIELEKKVSSLFAFNPFSLVHSTRHISIGPLIITYADAPHHTNSTVPRIVHPVVRSPCRDHQRLRSAYRRRAQSWR